MIKFVVGEEKQLSDLLCAGEVLPLLQGTVRAGAAEVAVTDAAGTVLWQERNPAAVGKLSGTLPIHLEGEPVGALVVKGEREEVLKGIAGLLLVALRTLMTNNLKRMLTTEMHTSVVNLSYEELLETNRQLAISEGKYRELAENLEKIVEERTRELKKAHARLLQQEKMASIGQLAAGMAHEINNPLGFINSNLNTLQKYVARLMTMLDLYRSLAKGRVQAAAIAPLAEEKWRELKLDMVCADISDLLNQSIDGAERVRKIVADLKGFSHIDDAAVGLVDINLEIDRTLSVLTHEIPDDADIIRNYQPLPGFLGNPALLCQVFLNIIQNALQARSHGLRLVISTACDEAAIRVSFADNGPGIPVQSRHRIFEPFYTTREVGAGTGMGLAVVYEIISGYGGTIDVECPAGGGAIFSLILPRQEMEHGKVL